MVAGCGQVLPQEGGRQLGRQDAGPEQHRIRRLAGLHRARRDAQLAGGRAQSDPSDHAGGGAVEDRPGNW
eukprot:8864194-Alexandrium_andersonii.AAC.1